MAEEADMRAARLGPGVDLNNESEWGSLWWRRAKMSGVAGLGDLSRAGVGDLGRAGSRGLDNG